MITIDEDGNAHESEQTNPRDEMIRITEAPLQAIELQRPESHLVPQRVRLLPVPPSEITISFLEEMQYRGAMAVRAIELGWYWLPKLVSLIYMGLTMDFKGILKMLASLITAFLAAKFGIGEGTQILGFDLSQIIIVTLAFIGGWVLPQLRSFVPKPIRDLVGWKVDDNG